MENNDTGIILKGGRYAIYKNEEKYELGLADYGYGHEHIEISKEALDLLVQGNALGLYDGEYTHWIVLEKESKNE